jgi:lysophospholipase L1-like esterase
MKIKTLLLTTFILFSCLIVFGETENIRYKTLITDETGTPLYNPNVIKFPANTVNDNGDGSLSIETDGNLSNAFRSYVTTIGTTPVDGYRVNQFFLALDAAGLTSYLVDGCFLRTNQNIGSSTSLLTIRGATSTIVGSPSIGPNGVVTNGSSQYVYWGVSNTTASSVAVTYKGVPLTQVSNGCIWSYQNNTGLGTGAASNTGGMDLQYNGLTTGYVFTGQDATVAVTSAITDPTSSSASTIHAQNPYEQIDIVTNDNAASPSLTAYVDGKLCLNDTSGNVQTTVARNRFYVGAREYNAGGGGVQNYGVGTHTNWFLFNKVLNATEAKALSDAMRWLNPAKKNIVFIGDSTSAWLSSKSTDSWTYQYSTLKKASDSRIYNTAVNGQSTGFFNTNYDDFVKRYRPGVNGVDESYAFVWLGINDINGGSSDSTTYTALKTLWASLKRDGFRVYANTLMPGTSYTGNKETYRVALTTSILSNTSLYDNVYRPDILFPDPNDSIFYLDGFHLQTLGNTVMANAVSADTVNVPYVPLTYVLTDSATIATNAALIPDGGLAYVTLGGNRTLGNPTNPRSGQKITYRFTQDGTGNRTLALDTQFSTGPYTVTLSTNPNKTDYLEAIYNLIANKWNIINFQKGY